MFLNLLNKREKENFLELAHEAMNANGVIVKSEEAIYQIYKMETGLLDYERKGKPLEELITAFKSSTTKIKKAVLIELAGVIKADTEIDENEEKWIFKLGEAWGFRIAEIRRMIRWTTDFNELLAEGYEYINK